MALERLIGGVLVRVIDMVRILREGKVTNIDYAQDRYSIITSESNGNKTAYCFSVPIYDDEGCILEPVFCVGSGVIHMKGSNAVVNIKDNISIRNRFGVVKISHNESSRYNYISKEEVSDGNVRILPALNGIQCVEKIDGKSGSFVIRTNYNDANIWANNKCFSIMRENYTPLVSVSCIGALDADTNVIAPAYIEYKKVDETRYDVKVKSASLAAEHVAYEINMYEPKLFQDTTVESNDSQCNNVFGGMAFIGNTDIYGEQWLYIRPDMGLVDSIPCDSIRYAKLHLPVYRDEHSNIKAYKVSRRFCSFGTNWDNKVPINSKGIIPSKHDGYLSFDITNIFVGRTLGYIIKPELNNDGYICVSTGDNYIRPVILECCYRG